MKKRTSTIMLGVIAATLTGCDDEPYVVCEHVKQTKDGMVLCQPMEDDEGYEVRHKGTNAISTGTTIKQPSKSTISSFKASKGFGSGGGKSGS